MATRQLFCFRKYFQPYVQYNDSTLNKMLIPQDITHFQADTHNTSPARVQGPPGIVSVKINKYRLRLFYLHHLRSPLLIPNEMPIDRRPSSFIVAADGVFSRAADGLCQRDRIVLFRTPAETH